MKPNSELWLDKRMYILALSDRLEVPKSARDKAMIPTMICASKEVERILNRKCY